MIEIKGEHGTAIVFTDNLESSARGLIKAYCDRPHSADNKIRVMPDVHAGKGCTIGTTMTIKDKVVPNIVGVDIGCGILMVKLKEKRIDLPKLDSYIKKRIPAGREIHSRSNNVRCTIDPEELRCFGKADLRYFRESLGTLGGGNHFIELDSDGDDIYLLIHTGSRNPGLKVAEYYQGLAYQACKKSFGDEIPYELAYLSGEQMDDYLHDMEIMQEYARLNRQIIKDVIMKGLKLKEEGSICTIHNYVDTRQMILRKGAVSAQCGEELVIPMNMRDGSLICTGRGNEEWNYSAPHGAGRLMSRAEALNTFSMKDFKASMDGIFSTTVTKEVLDESPFVYKPVEEILSKIRDTVNVEKIIKPVYNFKAGE